MRASSRPRSMPRCRCSRWRCALRAAAGAWSTSVSARARVLRPISCVCSASRRWMPRYISSPPSRPVRTGAGAWPSWPASASPRPWRIGPHEPAPRSGISPALATAQRPPADHALLQRRAPPVAAARGEDRLERGQAGGRRWRRRGAPDRRLHRAADPFASAWPGGPVPWLGRQRRFHLRTADRQPAAGRRLGHLPPQFPRPWRQPWTQRGAVPLLPPRRGVHALGDIAARWPTRPMALAGFSLGGNFALRAAMQTSRVGIPLSYVLAVCPIVDPAVGLFALEETAPWIYQAYFMRKWRHSL